MEKNSFLFDMNRCVGCMACVAGCSIENGTHIPLNWREVNTYNTIRHPELPVFYFSLACNHCSDAPCMKHCPAMAYTRDEASGAIIHHAEACIGCSYCTWACPYDAPKLNTATHIIEKCNFCVDRIREGKNPACVAACPVGALDFGKIETSATDYLVPGFVDTGIRPSIKLTPLRNENTHPEISNSDATTISKDELQAMLPKLKSKVNLEKDWTLVVFTLVVAALVSWFTAGVTHQIAVSSVKFIIIAVSAIILTSLHIGKKLRMWRFILNFRHSWLSLEILSFSTFLGFGVFSLFANNKATAYLAILFGIISIISVDLVYRILQRKEKNKLHSAMILLTAILFWAWLIGNPVFIGLITIIKAGLYIQRKIFYRKISNPTLPVFSGIRLFLLIVPVIALFSMEAIPMNLIISMIFIGEIIDRAEFYREAKVITPENKLEELVMI